MRLLLMLPLLLACQDPNAEASDDGGLAWEPCPLYFEGKQRPLAQCATVDVPLRHGEPDGPTLELFVQRRLSSKPATRQLWLLAGGPGQPGAVFEEYVDKLPADLPATDIYVVDHRGVGRSTRLGCGAEADDSPDGFKITEEEWPACIDEVVAQWGDDLGAFSVDEAARDLAWLVERLRGDQQVFLYGGSYGTTLGHRFLQHFPDTVDGVVLDSVAVDVDHRVYDQEFDEIGQQFLALCASDERCHEALGDDPYAVATDVLARVAAGHCPGTVDAASLRLAAGAFLADRQMRGFIPALFHRMDRCTDDDVADIARLRALLVDRPLHYTERLHSKVLFANIELSEQWPEPWPDLEELEAARDASAFSFGLGPSQRPLLDLWPRYPLDPVAGQLAVTDTPILILQGGLDPQTPPARTLHLADHFDAPGQNLVLFPQGTHILLRATPTGSGDCATELVAAFLDDPLAAPDTGCVARVAPVSFTGEPLISKLLLTDWSRYGNGCRGGAATAMLLPMMLLSRRRRRHSTR